MRSFHRIILGAIVAITLLVPSAVNPQRVVAGGFCEWAQFVSDVTVPDGWLITPGFVFKKTWRLKNIGTCTWTRAYSLVFAGGDQMGGVSAVNLPTDVPPGSTVDISVDLTAPTAPGLYRGYWKLRNPSGGLFGIGTTATNAIWVSVEVIGRSYVVYDFAANMCSANWRSEWGGKLPCAGVIPDERGVVMKLDQPVLETGSPAAAPGILMIPPFEYNESIYGIYPDMDVQYGDRFQSQIGCEYGAAGCEVQFVIKYKLPNEFDFSRTYWSGIEKNDGKFRNLNLSLNGLAGKRVSFMLLIRPLGETTKDRALWAGPVLVRPNAPVTPGPTSIPPPSTPLPIPTSGTLPPGSTCDRATFVSDVTVPDGSIFAPGQQFTKTWRLKNSGTCTWSAGYSAVFSSGEQMGAPASVAVPGQVAPGQTVDVSVNMIAPANPGTYRGYWLLRNSNGALFGIGSTGTSAFWLEIRTSGAPSSGTAYDFAANLCQARWTSGGGSLPCPGNPDSGKGYGLLVNSPVLENNTTDSRPAILMVPQNVYNGFIQASYPNFTIQRGDRFQATISCEFGAKGCYAVYRIDYQVNNGPVVGLWSFGERYEGLYYQADVDLSPLAGQTVQFILSINASGSPVDDRALWVGPRILRTGVTGVTPVINSPAPPPSTATSAPGAPAPQPTQTPSSPAPATLTPVPSPVVVDATWSTYQNTTYSFGFKFPPGTSISGSSAEKVVFRFPFTPGTSLVEKYLQTDVRTSTGTCVSPMGWTANSSSNVSVSGINFYYESGSAVVADKQNDWRSYSTIRNGNCISLSFVLTSNSSGSPAPFNQAVESTVFDAILSTFAWTGP